MTVAPGVSAKPRRDRATWISYLQLGTYTWSVFAFAVTIPLIATEYGSTRFAVSFLGTAFAVGAIFAAFSTGRWPAGQHRGLLIRGAGITAAAALLAIVFTPFGPIMFMAAGILGSAVTIVLIGVNAFLVEHQRDASSAALSEGNTIASLTSLLAPLTVAAFVALSIGWRPALGLAAVFWVLLELSRGRDLSLYATQPKTHVETPHQPLPRHFWRFWILALFVAGVEFSVVFWGTDWLRDRGGLSDAASVAILATIGGGMTIGRAIGAKLVEKFPTDTVLVAFTVIALAALGATFASRQPVVLVVCFALVGIGMGPQWPLGVSRTLLASRNNSDAAASRYSGAASVAELAAPFLLAYVATTFGLIVGFLLVPLLLVGVIWVVLNTRSRPA